MEPPALVVPMLRVHSPLTSLAKQHIIEVYSVFGGENNSDGGSAQGPMPSASCAFVSPIVICLMGGDQSV